MPVRIDLLPEEFTQAQNLVVESILEGITGGFRNSQITQRQRRPKPAKDIEDFLELVGTVIDEQQELDGVAEEHRVKIVHDFVPQELTTEVITYGMLRRVPGSVTSGKAFNQRVPEYKPHIRAIEEDISYPGQKVITLGQAFDNEILLTCWAKTNKQANMRARWLEDTLRSWTWFIRYNGIENFFFVGQNEDILLNLDANQKVVGRPLVYYVRTQRESTIREPTIRKIVLKYKLDTV